MGRINTGIFRILASALALAALPAFAQDIAPLRETAPQPLPAMQFADAAGVTQRPDFTAHKLTAVHLWATWCVPCVAELPEVEAAQKAYAGRGLKIVAISLDTAMSKVNAFFDLHNINALTPYLDQSQASFKAVGGRGVPVTVFVNGKGEQIARADGPLDWQAKATTDFIDRNLSSPPP